MTIIHISTDYPDSFISAKTPAIRNMVEATSSDFDHQVYSLNRFNIAPVSGLSHWVGNSWHKGISTSEVEGNISTWAYDAPSRSLFMKSSLESLADRITEDILRRNLKPQLIHGHKLSMEGIIASRIAEQLDVPFAITIQGNTDRKLINTRRDLIALYRQIFHDAAVVFPFAPWALRFCENKLGKRQGDIHMLPCITLQDRIIAPKMSDNKIMSAFHLRHWKIKNFENMARAAKIARQQSDDFAFDIYGGGDAQLTGLLEGRAHEKGGDAVALKGPLTPDVMQQHMNDYAAFCMVSQKESYGMVFAEALLAGCPIIHPRDAAVDGYFDGQDFAMAVPANDVGAIAEAMQRAVRDQQSIKAKLYEWQQSSSALQFQRAAITENYKSGLTKALSAKKKK